jgi:hypothetical protein
MSIFMIPKKLLTLILIIQSTFDANKKGYFYKSSQIWQKKGLSSRVISNV